MTVNLVSMTRSSNVADLPEAVTFFQRSSPRFWAAVATAAAILWCFGVHCFLVLRLRFCGGGRQAAIMLSAPNLVKTPVGAQSSNVVEPSESDG